MKHASAFTQANDLAWNAQTLFHCQGTTLLFYHRGRKVETAGLPAGSHVFIPIVGSKGSSNMGRSDKKPDTRKSVFRIVTERTSYGAVDIDRTAQASVLAMPIGQRFTNRELARSIALSHPDLPAELLADDMDELKSRVYLALNKSGLCKEADWPYLIRV